MKKLISVCLILVFALVNAFSFIGCKQVNAQGKTIACWVASIGNLDYPSDQGLGADALKKEIDDIVDHCRMRGINTVFFQVRPNGDALYKSEIFPWSVYLSGKQGIAPEKEFDPLAYFVETAHQYNIELHAWINPYRIGSGNNVWKDLSADNPAVLHKDYAVTTDAGVYYNPGLPEVRRLIIQGVSEIVRNYDVDGIHFDDYFYPYDMNGFDDSAAYNKYGKKRSLEDFRRESVDALVENVYKTIKTIDASVEFGISPFGIWANDSVSPAGSKTSGMSSYSEIFSDSKKWVEKGWLDYICPQIYWSFDHPNAPYDVLVDWWSELCAKNKMKLYIGLALYKMGTDEIGWDDPYLIEDQINYAAQKKSYAGHCFFRYKTLLENPLGCTDDFFEKSNQINEEEVDMNNSQTTIVLAPASALSVTSPENGITVQGNGISVTGVVNAGQKVWVNGHEAITNSKGLFAAYVSLKEGKNLIKINGAGQTETIEIYRAASIAKKYAKPENLYPCGNVSRNVGDVISFSVNGPENAFLSLDNGIINVPLKEVSAGYYTAEWTVPNIGFETVDLTAFQCRITAGGQLQSYPVDLNLHLYGEGYREIFYLRENAYLFDESQGGSQMDHAPLPKGLKIKVIGKEGTRSLLENGYWIENETLTNEKVSPTEPCSYNYHSVTIPIEAGTAVSHFYRDGAVYVSVNRSCEGASFDAEDGLKVQVQKNNVHSIYRIQGEEKQIAGYELYPRNEEITVFVHFKDGDINGKKIVLDPGHGGADQGALSAGGAAYPTESDLNLALAQKLKESLEEEGAQVTMLRRTDRAIPLDNRVEYAEKKSADLFISLHHNSTVQTRDFNSVSGGSVHYSSPIALEFADALSKSLWNGLREEGTVRVVRQSLRVCRQTKYPAVLIEAGYVCNPMEYEKLCDEKTTDRLCENIVEGIKLYFKS